MVFSLHIPALLLFSVLFLFSFPAHAALRAANETECVAMRASLVDATTGKPMECIARKTIIDDKIDEILLHLSKGADSPIAFLESRSCKGVVVACTDPEFAKRLQTFILAAEEAGKQGGWKVPYITSMYRSPGAQTRELAMGNSKVGPCGSYHQYSLAADFNSDDLRRGLTPAIEWMRANANTYGFSILRASFDPAHFQIKDVSVRALKNSGACGRCNAPPSGKVTSCTGSGAGGDGLVNKASSAIGNAFSQLTRPLTELFRPQSAVPQPPSALPPTTRPDIFGTTTPTAPLPNTPTSNMPPANFQSTQPSVPQTADEILAQIAIGPPQATTTATTTRPLTAEEIQSFYAQQVRLGINVPQGNVAVSPVGIQPLNIPTYAGFTFTDEQLNQAPSQELIRYYYQVLTRVSFALAEIIRILRGDPPFDPNNPSWLTE